MPLEPLTLTEPLVEKLIRLYNQAERDLLTQMAERLKQGITEDGWQERQLLELQRYRRQAQQVLEKLRANRRPLVDEAVAAAANRGAAVAIGDLTPTIAGALSVQQVDTYAVLALAAELNMDLDAADNVILRAVDDMYRRVVASETSRVLLGTQTRQQAADIAFRRLAANGIHAFTDKAGRKWEMRSYLESATRGTLTNATIEGHSAKLLEYGLELVVVSDVPQECERCRPFEGKTLALRSSDQYVSLDEARARGLFHPGCRHALAAKTSRTRSFGATADPAGEKARQKLRYLERQVRAAKREQLAALDPAGVKAAAAKQRAVQAKIREHVATHDINRQRHREQLNTGR